MTREDLRKLLFIYNYYRFSKATSAVYYINIFKSSADNYNISIAELIDIVYIRLIHLTPIVHGYYNNTKHNG